MTFGHAHDRQVLEGLLGREFAYLGLMGSKAKVRQMYAAMVADGIPESELARRQGTGWDFHRQPHSRGNRHQHRGRNHLPSEPELKPMPEISFQLNGHLTTASYEDGMHFLEVLRECCGITSVKDGCAPQGVCGCCTILLNGKPALACQLDPAKADDAEVVTLEGLPERQRQLLAGCFCSRGRRPVRILHSRHRHSCGPPHQQRVDRRIASRVERGLAGHLCRCTGYNRIVDAIQTAGEAWQRGAEVGDGPPRRPHHFGEDYGLERSSQVPRDDGVGASSGRYRGQDQTLGAKHFVADMTEDGMLHGALVLSDHPRARVLRIDTSKASLPAGVERILTAEDIPGICNHGLLLPDWPLLVAQGETTRYVGDVLAVVVADSQHRARMAAEAVEVEYEVLDPVRFS